MRLLALAGVVVLLVTACTSVDLDALAQKAEADYEERGEMGDAGDVRFVVAARDGRCVAVVLAYPKKRGGGKVVVPMRLVEGGNRDDPADWEVLAFVSGTLDQLDGKLERCGYP